MTNYNRMGIGAVAVVLELWTDRQLELTEEEYDALCDRLVQLLGDSRDETWRLARGSRPKRTKKRDDVADEG